MLAGHVPAVLAWPTTRVDAEKYQRNLVHQLSHLPADLLITLPNLAQNISGVLAYAVRGIGLENGAHFANLFPAGPVSEQLECKKVGERNARPTEEALFLQFSGGTTGAQKAIVVTAEMLWEQLERLGEALQFTAEDGVVSWLPLYHDMGLIACYWMPLWHGAASMQMAAGDWVINPELLLRYIRGIGRRSAGCPILRFLMLANGERTCGRSTYWTAFVHGSIARSQYGKSR